MVLEQTRWLPLVVGVLVLVIALGLALSLFFGDELFPEASPTQRGAAVAREAGCFSCHSMEDEGGSVNPTTGARSRRFPLVHSMFEERHSLTELRQWIENGVSDRKKEDPRYERRRERSTLKMPAYREQLDPFQIEDLMAYVALRQYQVATRKVPVPHPGERVARQYACFTCHGELGQGGVENPGSLKGYIPGFFGTDFRALTRNGDPQDLREWILQGRSDFFWDQGFAGFYPGRFFTERQAIKMPAYQDLLSEEEVQVLVDYLLELMELGPLQASGLIEYRPIQEEARQDRSEP